MWPLWKSYLQGDLPAIPRGTGYCWSHVEDIAAAHFRAMVEGEPGEAYIIAGEPYTLVEAFDVAAEVTGIDPPRAVSPAIFRWLARAVRLLETVYTPPKKYRSEALRVIGGATYWGNNAKATREIGLEHRPFEDGLRETLEYERTHLEA
jgi:nucleoside-diphosphate-sugar epimerase